MPDMMAEMPVAEATEQTSIFIPREALGDRECKPGEKLTVTVKDVDEDTGEVEAVVEGYEDKAPESSGVQEALDELPDE